MPSATRLVLLLLTALATGTQAVEVALAAPLTTLVRLPEEIAPGGSAIEARIVVPADAPADLGVGAFICDRHGRWFQRPVPGVLAAGAHDVRIELGDTDPAVGDGPVWDAAQAAITARSGLYFWSTAASRAVLTIENLHASPLARGAGRPPRLTELTLPATARTGERWEASLRPQPFPDNPYDPAQFALDLVVTTPSGRTDRIPGFAALPMRANDRGDREELTPAGRELFHARWRPREPGTHRLRLEATWSGGRTVACDLAPVTVAGAPWDDYVRVDAGDPRFFSTGGKHYWPIGTNLRAVNDGRCSERMGTRMTPDRGTLAYAAFLARLGANGGNAAEIWLSSWNLALEWRGDWPETQGLGRYSQEHAWRLDRILDLAWAQGIRLDVVLNNHGQMSEQVDREWGNNPYARSAGGILDHAIEWFTDSRALVRQDAVRRYLVARYADHPAVLDWKLLSEQNLTAANDQGDLLARWHTNAARRWQELDTYHHPLTTHWSTSWRSVRGEVASLKELDFLTIDAYHDTLNGNNGEVLCQLLTASTARRGLGRYGKPVLVTEYGGQWSACPEPQMDAEHASSGFVALTTGHAGAPMLWWFEWVDQRDRFAPYRALAAFTASEDLRGAEAKSLALQADDNGTSFWCHAWSRPGRMLGYLLDEGWQATGERAPEHRSTTILIGDQVSAGALTVAWWDADAGTELARTDLAHTGGRLELHPPIWRRHLAFKLWRRT